MLRRAAAVLFAAPPLGASAEQWARHPATNCYTGKGATDLENPAGNPCGTMTLEACEAKCDELPACQGVTVSTNKHWDTLFRTGALSTAPSDGAVDCYRRGDIHIGTCSQNPAFDTWVRSGAPAPAPTPAPAPGPGPAPQKGWVEVKGHNCYDGHGATDLESPAGSDCGTMSLAACEGRCDALPGCVAVVVTAGGGDQHKCYRRGGEISLDACSQDSGYDLWAKSGELPPTPPPTPAPSPVAPPSKWVFNYNPKNPLNIVPDKTRSNNYFLIIGDWGKSEVPADPGTTNPPRPGDCQHTVAKKMKSYVAKQKAAGKTLLFVAAVGDNFYWNGVRPDVSWNNAWSSVYGVNDTSSPLYGVPWLAVLGNHDYGDMDMHIACPWISPMAEVAGQPYASNQFNADRNPTRPAWTEKYWMPDYSYHYEIPEVGFELIAIDRNYMDLGGLGGGWNSQSFAACGGSDKVSSFLATLRDAGDSLLRDRAANGAASTVFVIQHYPGACARDVFEAAVPAGRSVRYGCAYGHLHDQKCDGRDAGGNCDMIMTGGGGGCCGPEVDLAGFTSVALDDDGGFVTDVESDAVRLQNGQCHWNAPGW